MVNLYRSANNVTQVTQTLIAVNLMMALVVFVNGGFGNPLTYIAAGADVPQLVKAGDYWRWVSATFIHADLVHLAFNMFALYQLGTLIEKLYGSSKMLIIYVLSGIGGSIISDIFMHHGYSVGASGAVFGLVGAALGMGLRHRDQLSPAFKQYLVSGLGPLVIFNFLIGLNSQVINNWAHGGGFVTGFICGYLIYPDLAYYQPRRTPFALYGTIAVSLILVYTTIFMLPSALKPSYGYAHQPMRQYVDPHHRFTFKYPKIWNINNEEAIGMVMATTELYANFSVIIIPLTQDLNPAALSKPQIDSLIKQEKLLLSEFYPKGLKSKTSIGKDAIYVQFEARNDENAASPVYYGISILNRNNRYQFVFQTRNDADYFYKDLAQRMLQEIKITE